MTNNQMDLRLKLAALHNLGVANARLGSITRYVVERQFKLAWEYIRALSPKAITKNLQAQCEEAFWNKVMIGRSDEVLPTVDEHNLKMALGSQQFPKLFTDYVLARVRASLKDPS